MIDPVNFEKELLGKFRKDAQYRHYLLTYYHIPFVVLMTKLQEVPPAIIERLIQPILHRALSLIVLKFWLRSFTSINACFLKSVHKDIIRAFGKQSNQAITVAAYLPLMETIFRVVEELPTEERVMYKTCMIAAYPKAVSLVPDKVIEAKTILRRQRAELMIRERLTESCREALPLFEALLRCRNANA